MGHLVIVDDLDIVGVAAAPTEANAELVVDADAMLTDALACKFLKSVGWWDLEVGEGGGGVEHSRAQARSKAASVESRKNAEIVK
jgi:hypothetical protein